MEEEKWVDVLINVDGLLNPPKYAISNLGRLKSFQRSSQGQIIRGSTIQGYNVLNIKLPKGISFCRYIHKVIAEAFLEKSTEEHRFVIHLDYNKLNNHYSNLQCVTREEMKRHNKVNPNIIKKRKPVRNKLA